jgi:hypothetical protein
MSRRRHPNIERTTRYLVGTAEDVTKLADLQLAALRREIEGGSDSVMPSLLVMTRRRNAPAFELALNVLAVPVVSGNELNAAVAALAMGLVEQQVFPVAAAFASEAWQSVQDRKGPVVEPRLDPNRKEVLSLAAAAMRTFTAAGGPLRAVIIPVKRGPKNELLQDGEARDDTHEYPAAAGHRCGSPLLATFFRAFHLACNAAAPRDLRADRLPGDR